jgi:hypothetical protein
MPLSVQLLAMSPSSQKTLAGFIKTTGKKHFVLSDDLMPNVLIIDIDNTQGKQYLSHYQNSETKLITLSLAQQDDIPASVIQIQKPFTGVEILRSAEKIKELKTASDLEKNKALKQSAINEKERPDNKQPSLYSSYDPSTTFQGMLRKAIQLSDKKNTPVLITIQQYRVEIYADKNTARLNFSKKRLRTLCQFPLTDQLCDIKKITLVSDNPDDTTIALPELSWEVAILCSRGRLPKNMADDAQYQLKKWPNLTRWSQPESALKIAGLWSKSPNNINNIARQLSIPIEHVCSFITAAIDSNLAQKCNGIAEIIPFKTENTNSALFRKLLNRLKRA